MVFLVKELEWPLSSGNLLRSRSNLSPFVFIAACTVNAIGDTGVKNAFVFTFEVELINEAECSMKKPFFVLKH